MCENEKGFFRLDKCSSIANNVGEKDKVLGRYIFRIMERILNPVNIVLDYFSGNFKQVLLCFFCVLSCAKILYNLSARIIATSF